MVFFVDMPRIFRVYSFSRFIVLGRVRIRRTWTLSRARDRIARSRVIRRRRRAVGGRDGDGIVMGHDSSCRGPRARPASSSLGLDSTRPIDSIDRSIDRSVGRARGSRLMMSCSFIHSFIHSRAGTCDGDVGTRARARDDETRDDDDGTDDDGSTRGGLEDAGATREGGRGGVGGVGGDEGARGQGAERDEG